MSPIIFNFVTIVPFVNIFNLCLISSPVLEYVIQGFLQSVTCVTLLNSVKLSATIAGRYAQNLTKTTTDELISRRTVGIKELLHRLAKNIKCN